MYSFCSTYCLAHRFTLIYDSNSYEMKTNLAILSRLDLGSYCARGKFLWIVPMGDGASVCICVCM